MAPIKSKVGEIRLTTKEDIRVALTCPSCGNDQNFLVKTLQMHVVHLEDSRVEVSEEGRPAVLEVQCDECETALNFEEIDEAVRRELLLTLGARCGARRLPAFNVLGFRVFEVIAFRAHPLNDLYRLRLRCARHAISDLTFTQLHRLAAHRALFAGH